MRSLSDRPGRGSSGFQQVVSGFLSQPGLPFASVLSAERIERIFTQHQNLFAIAQIYSTAVTLWAFLGQVLDDVKSAACQAAVANIVTYRLQGGETTPTSDTGDYCRARSKLSATALRAVTVEVAAELETQADPQWLWKGLHAKLVDGLTFTMPDTPQNQAVYPSPKSQKKGVGLPIARAVVMLSLATCCALDVAFGPYAGKKTGETALLRSLLGSFLKGDLAVMDRYYCSFMMIALLLGRGVQVCARAHQKRHVDFRRGQRLGTDDHLIVWTKPPRPTWMEQSLYETIPATLELRELRYQVVEPGYRTQTLTVVTTLTDAKLYTKADLAELYGFRWNAELDIRSIKQSLNLCHLRCKSPDMVRKELWVTFLGYNLIRSTAAAAALLHDQRPRQISFTGTCQYVLASWMLLAANPLAADKLESYCRTLLQKIAECKVANRPGRIEPRVLKRRRHGYKLMQEPRHILKARLMNGNHN